MTVMKKFKKGMTIAEMLLAFAVCAVIFLVSINMFRLSDITRIPYVYSTMNNLQEVNEFIMEDCFYEKTCIYKNTLPDSLEEYCTRLSEKYNTSGNIICNSDETHNNLINSDTALYQRVNDDDTYNYNLKLASGVAIYGILDNTVQGEEGNNVISWKPIQIEGSSAQNKYIDVVIDTNGKNGPNVFLDDIYPVRIFSNGDVVPGVLRASEHEGKITINGFDDADIYDYFIRKKVINEAKTSTNISTADIRTATEKNAGSKVAFQELSFREALCRAYGNNKATIMLRRYYNDIMTADDWCSGIAQNAQADDCIQNDTVCEVEQTRPKTNGFVKFIGI